MIPFEILELGVKLFRVGIFGGKEYKNIGGLNESYVKQIRAKRGGL